VTDRIMVMSWDWREQPDLADLEEKLSHLGIFMTNLDTGSDQYAIVLSGSFVTPEKAKAAYKRYLLTGSDDAPA